MYYIKIYLFQQIARSKIITYFLHKLWIFYQYLRSNYLYFKFYKLKIKINSLSERGQDKWIIDIFELKKKRYKGYFLDIGGGDGFSNSNSFILEKYFNWEGLLVEPDPDQFKKLKIIRSRTLLSNRLIYDTTRNLSFLKDGELSKILTNIKDKTENKILKMNSISLNELLDIHKVPKIIDFFSLDVEGSEEKVITEKVLNNYTFLSLCIERPTIKLHELLVKKNYVFIQSNLYDCFYLHKSFINFKKISRNKKKFTGFYEGK